MVDHHARLCIARLVVILAGLGMVGGKASAGDDEGVAFFEKHIRPVLVQHCYECHGPRAETPGGGLLLDSRQAMRVGGESGPAVAPAETESSLLLDAIRYDGLEMPPKGKLPPNVIARFEEWVRMGAPDPRQSDAESKPTRAAIDFKAGLEFWAFQPPQRSPLPQVGQTSWPRQRIDSFVLAQLEARGLQPAEQSTRATFIRRASLDVTGLPPTPDEVRDFVKDRSPSARERLVERLLASPHYGERWTRMWLDVARYAEDQAHIVGDNSALFYPNAYRYRDWVIDALNRDAPYDEFLQQQLAADVISPSDEAAQAALGFIGLGPKYYRRGDLSVMADEWEDRVNTVARGVLGLTVACARCHDHKFDPIATEDYYALAGVFASTEMYNRPLGDAEQDKKGQAKKPDQALHIVRDAKVRDLPVFIRGDVTAKGPIVPRRFLSILSEGPPNAFTQGSGRWELAQALTADSNPLTARVLVNRVWAQLFGRGLVGTPSNFGELGDRPSHPLLLDDLAQRFMAEGRWSLKWLLRELLLSSTYDQSSQGRPATVAADPSNRWLGRMSRRRLSIEAWRDMLLAVNGRLTRQVHGESFDPQDPTQVRRTVYSRISRLDLNPLLALFDFPDPNAHAAARAETTTPLQKLFVMNSPFMASQAAAFADRLLDAPHADWRAQVQLAYQLLYSRDPAEAELQAAVEYLRQCGGTREAWRQYAHVLLASNEALFVD